jgi:pseudouridine synthase
VARAAGASRRDADAWIRLGRVFVNGAPPAAIGLAVDPAHDRVTLDGHPIVLPAEHRYLAYHKPRGLIVSRRSQGGKRTIFDSLGGRARGLHAVGRLDFESEGLLLLTDDGDLSEALLHPRTALLRRYRVWTRPVPEPVELRRLEEGTTVEDVRVQPLRVALEGADRGAGILTIDLQEGKKREVRVLARAAGLSVERLLRVQFGPVVLGPLRPGALRPLSDPEITALRRAAFRGTKGGGTLRRGASHAE